MDTKNLTIKQFYDILSQHDWYYQYSDDHNVWKRGQEESSRIRQILQVEHPRSYQLRELYNQWVRFVNKQGPRPVQPQ